MKGAFTFAVLAAALFRTAYPVELAVSESHAHGHHKHHHHGKHGHGHHSHSKNHGNNKTVVSAVQTEAHHRNTVATNQTHVTVADKTKTVLTAAPASGVMTRGRLHMNGPLPPDFADRFAQASAEATGCQPADFGVVDKQFLDSEQDTVVVDFEAPTKCVHEVEDQAADPHSHLAHGNMRPFLVADDAPAASSSSSAGAPVSAVVSSAAENEDSSASGAEEGAGDGEEQSPSSDTPVQDDGIDVDTAMPYGELEPFGREDTAQELTESSIGESNEMVDQLERAEVAEEKRAVFRALTRLRGAAITSFDGIARSQTGNIDEYNKVHKWRNTHPLSHLADEESDIAKWAFPSDADF